MEMRRGERSYSPLREPEEAEHHPAFLSGSPGKAVCGWVGWRKKSQGGPASAWVSWRCCPGLCGCGGWGEPPEGIAAVVKTGEGASRAEVPGTRLGQAQGSH